MDLNLGQEPRQAHGVEALRATDVDHGLQPAPGQAEEGRVELGLVGAQQPRGERARGGEPAIGHAGERSVQNGRSLALQERVGDQLGPPPGRELQHVGKVGLLASEAVALFDGLRQQRGVVIVQAHRSASLRPAA